MVGVRVTKDIGRVGFVGLTIFYFMVGLGHVDLGYCSTFALRVRVVRCLVLRVALLGEFNGFRRSIHGDKLAIVCVDGC